MMSTYQKAELENLKIEFQWVIKEEVPKAFKQMMEVLQECCSQFPVPICGQPVSLKQDKFIMSTQPHTTQDQVKCIVAIAGDNIIQADINLKISKHPTQQHRAGITPDNPWKIQQIQDTANFVQLALKFLEARADFKEFKTSSEILVVLNEFVSILQKAQNSLLIPRKRTIDELIHSRNMKCLNPPLSPDLALSFYLQAHKLVLAVYHMGSNSSNVRFDSVQAECSIPWLTQILVYLTTTVSLAQQLCDKISVFSQYKDFIPPNE